MTPTFVLTLWFQGMLSMGLIGGSIWLVHEWFRRGWVYDVNLQQYVFDPNWGFNTETTLLVLGLALAVWAIAGSLILRLVWSLRGQTAAGGRNRSESPKPIHEGITQRLQRPNGAELNVEFCGPEGAPVIILTHGWGANSTEWYYLRRQLSDRYRLIAWDLPGLGRSKRPWNDDFRLETMAHDLDAVLDLAGGQPALLLGHSIGGMITLTYARLFPEKLGPRVAGLALVHTTYTNPVRTTQGAGFYTAIEKPVIVPLLYLTIGLWPLVWLWSCFSYINGSAHRSTRKSGFGGTETWDQIDFMTRYQLYAEPDVLARGMFGMMHYDATSTLSSITVPTLVIPGDRDPVCKPEASERMAREIPGAELAPLSPAKHMGLIEHNERFAALVDQFAASCLVAPNTTVVATHTVAVPNSAIENDPILTQPQPPRTGETGDDITVP